MSDQEILFRMFIIQFMEWYPFESIISDFDHVDTLAGRVLPLFPREIEPEDIDGGDDNGDCEIAVKAIKEVDEILKAEKYKQGSEG